MNEGLADLVIPRGRGRGKTIATLESVLAIILRLLPPPKRAAVYTQVFLALQIPPILGDFESRYLNPDIAFGEIEQPQESSFSMGSIKSQPIPGTPPRPNRLCSKSPILGDLGGD
jgi:hypothetical protein